MPTLLPGTVRANGQFPGSQLTSLLPLDADAAESGAFTKVGAAMSPSIPVVTGKTAYIIAFDVVIGPGAAGSDFVIVTGIASPLYFAASPGEVLSIRFPYAIPALSPTTPITLLVPALGGAAGVNTADVYGFQL